MDQAGEGSEPPNSSWPVSLGFFGRPVSVGVARPLGSFQGLTFSLVRPVPEDLVFPWTHACQASARYYM